MAVHTPVDHTVKRLLQQVDLKSMDLAPDETTSDSAVDTKSHDATAEHNLHLLVWTDGREVCIASSALFDELKS